MHNRNDASSGSTTRALGALRAFILLVVAAVFLHGVGLGFPDTASAAPPHDVPPGPPDPVPPKPERGPPDLPTPGPDECKEQNSIVVEPAGLALADRQAIQDGINEGQETGKCVILKGQFGVGPCFMCLEITAPVTLVGQADPTGNNPNPRDLTVIRALSGLGILSVNVVPGTAPQGEVRISDIWFRGAGQLAVSVVNLPAGDTLTFTRNRLTNIMQGLFGFRFGIAGSGALPNSVELAGHVAIRDNYINTTGIPFLLGDDNGVAFQNVQFETIEITGNTSITNGESMEVEQHTGRKVVLSDNFIMTRRVTPSLLGLKTELPAFPSLDGGGHPASIKWAGNDTEETIITNNEIYVGSSRTAVCIGVNLIDPDESVYAKRTTVITNNTCTMSPGIIGDGIFAGMMLGWSGENPFYDKGSLENAIVEDNTLVGRAQFGITMMDFHVPLAPANDLINTSHDNVFRGNDFSQFSPGTASVYFGPSTFDNVFEGDPNGPVIDEGTNNSITP